MSEKLLLTDSSLRFTKVSLKDLSLLARMETTSFPPEMVNGKDHIRDILKLARKTALPSLSGGYILWYENQPAGYFLLLVEKSDTRLGELAVHIHDFALMPEFRGKGLAPALIAKVFSLADVYAGSIAGFVGTVEAEARESTMYPLLTHPKTKAWLAQEGYWLSESKKLSKYMGGEDFYFVRFEKQATSSQTMSPVSVAS